MTLAGLPADDAAAKAGDFIRALVLKIDAVVGHAVDVLANEGMYDDLAQGMLSAAIAGGLEQDQFPDFWDGVIDDPAGFYAIAAWGGIEFIGKAPSPPAGEPWPEPYAAAVIVVDVYLFAKRVRELRRGLRRGEVNLQGFAELVWLGGQIGAVSDAFHPDTRAAAQNLAEARRQLLADRQSKSDGALLTNEAKRARIETDRDEALRLAPTELARAPLNRSGSWSLTRLSEAVAAAWQGEEVPSARVIRGYLKTAQTAGAEWLKGLA